MCSRLMDFEKKPLCIWQPFRVFVNTIMTHKLVLNTRHNSLTVNSMHLISRRAPKQPKNERRHTMADVMIWT